MLRRRHLMNYKHQCKPKSLCFISCLFLLDATQSASLHCLSDLRVYVLAVWIPLHAYYLWAGHDLDLLTRSLDEENSIGWLSEWWADTLNSRNRLRDWRGSQTPLHFTWRMEGTKKKKKKVTSFGTGKEKVKRSMEWRTCLNRNRTLCCFDEPEDCTKLDQEGCNDKHQ